MNTKESVNARINIRAAIIENRTMHLILRYGKNSVMAKAPEYRLQTGLFANRLVHGLHPFGIKN